MKMKQEKNDGHLKYFCGEERVYKAHAEYSCHGYQTTSGQGRIQDFSKGGSQSNGYNYIIIAIIHIINLNKVHCSLLKAIGA